MDRTPNPGLVVAFAAVVAAWPALATAHHPRPTARPSGGGLSFGLGARAPRAPTLDLRVGSQIDYFDRLQQDTASRDGGGSLLVGTLVSSARWRLRTGTELGARLPVGFVRSASSDGVDDTAFGLGDATLTVAQALTELWPVAPRRWSVRVSAGLILPTGRYRSDAALSFTDVAAGTEGQLDVVTYDTQASLGAGTWASVVGTEVGWRATDRLHLVVLGRWTEPLTTTPDDIRWGRDIDVQTGVSMSPWLDVLEITASVDYRFHDRDRIPNEDDEGRSVVGGRDEIGVAGGLAVRLTDRLHCGGRVHVPVWQRVGGVQLVETVSAMISCDVRVGL